MMKLDTQFILHHFLAMKVVSYLEQKKRRKYLLKAMNKLMK